MKKVTVTVRQECIGEWVIRVNDKIASVVHSDSDARLITTAVMESLQAAWLAVDFQPSFEYRMLAQIEANKA